LFFYIFSSFIFELYSYFSSIAVSSNSSVILNPSSFESCFSFACDLVFVCVYCNQLLLSFVSLSLPALDMFFTCTFVSIYPSLHQSTYIRPHPSIHLLTCDSTSLSMHVYIYIYIYIYRSLFSMIMCIDAYTGRGSRLISFSALFQLFLMSAGFDVSTFIVFSTLSPQRL